MQSKLHTAPPRKNVERSLGACSNESQQSQASAVSTKKPLKRQSLLPPVSAGVKQDFKKP